MSGCDFDHGSLDQGLVVIGAAFRAYLERAILSLDPTAA